MPYIKQDRRDEVDEVVDEMIRQEVKADGDLNYILFKFCKYSVKPSYGNLKNYCAELRQCATEIERQLLSNYEDEKILENGNV